MGGCLRSLQQLRENELCRRTQVGRVATVRRNAPAEYGRRGKGERPPPISSSVRMPPSPPWHPLPIPPPLPWSCRHPLTLSSCSRSRARSSAVILAGSRTLSRNLLPGPYRSAVAPRPPTPQGGAPPPARAWSAASATRAGLCEHVWATLLLLTRACVHSGTFVFVAYCFLYVSLD